MRLLRWFDTSELTAFAEVIAGDYVKLRKSVALRGDSDDKKHRKFEKLTQRVEEFHESRHLNFYQKAKMLDAIKGALHESGIEEPEITAFLKTLLLSGLKR